MLSFWQADVGQGNMVTCRHGDMLKLDHAVVLTCRQAHGRVPEQVPWFLLVAAFSCLHICGHMCYADILACCHARMAPCGKLVDELATLSLLKTRNHAPLCFFPGQILFIEFSPIDQGGGTLDSTSSMPNFAFKRLPPSRFFTVAPAGQD